MSLGNTAGADPVWGEPQRPLAGWNPIRIGAAETGRAAQSADERSADDALQLRRTHPEDAWGGFHRKTPLREIGPRRRMPAGMSGIGPNAQVAHREAFESARPTNTSTTEISARTSPYQARLTGPVQFLKKLIEVWGLKSADATVLLGLDRKDVAYAENVLAGQGVLKGRDVMDRVIHLFQIRKTLATLFRDEIVENQWLREPHRMLDESTPMDLMLEGSMENLLLVREYVETAAGR